VNWSP